MNVLHTHGLVRKLYEDTAELVVRYKLGDPPDGYDTGMTPPTSEEIDLLKQRLGSVQDALTQHAEAFRIARTRRTSHDPLIDGWWHSQHEWIVHRCQVLLRELSDMPRAGAFGEIFVETVYAAALKELTAEASVAAEIFQMQDPQPAADTTSIAVETSALEETLDDGPDGPCGIYQWRHRGEVIKGKLTRKRWELATLLFERRGNLVDVAKLIGPNNLFDTGTEIESVKRQARYIGNWFKVRHVNLIVETKKEHIFMLSEHQVAERGK